MSHADSISFPIGSSDNNAPATAASGIPASGDVLARVKSQEDVRNLSHEDLNALAQQVRRRIIEVIATKGGHFGSPLGAVEITVALLHVFDPLKDRIVWDVGHQAYAWKILTGRNDRFETIRQHGGLSGFLKRSENPADVFGAGHASTSIAAAYGMAQARDRQKKDHKVVAVIGDGSMTGGMAYEALNNAGLQRTNMMVLFNDNEMSISQNVWAVHKGLSSLITNPAYNNLKQDIKKMVRGLMGQRAVSTAHTMEGAVKGMLMAGPALFFEELGFRYIGPVDGHDLDQLIPIMRGASELEGPICLHVITKKGKGLTYAEADPIKYHAATQNMKIETGDMVKTDAPPAYTKVFGTTLTEIAAKDERVVAITAAMDGGTGTDIFATAFPERFYDVGIAEECAVTMAAGMAAEGMVPVCAIYSTFLQRAFDQILHDVALQHLPVRFVLDRGGLVGADGPTHHGSFDLTYMRLVPGMVLMAPRDEQELRRMLRTQIAYNDGPSAMRYPRGNATGAIDLATTEYPPLEIGKGEILQHGEKIALLGIGLMTQHFLKAAPLIEAKLGFKVTVADARFVKPLDRDMIVGLAQSHALLFTAEDNTIRGGFGSAVNELLAEENTGRNSIPFGLPDEFVDHGTPRELYRDLGLLPEQLAERIVTEFQKRTK
ncbi:1-deoxy-D-xylulose-5-phosphate synthase [Candidatus Sumerlaeota bacterium]|nr:1-deoxy-D-xylulose-5-phosphate synthase [Candidatus Sumerlaeota bacterium]